MQESPIPLEELLNRGYRYALSLTHDSAGAEDLIQDAWIKLQRANGPRQLSYFFTVIKNRHIDILRKKEPASMVVSTPDGPLPELADETQPGFDERIHFKESELATALEKIAPTEREAIFLLCVEEYTASEAAEFLGKPRGTILSLAHRAKQKLRSMLEKKNEGIPMEVVHE